MQKFHSCILSFLTWPIQFVKIWHKGDRQNKPANPTYWHIYSEPHKVDSYEARGGAQFKRLPSDTCWETGSRDKGLETGDRTRDSWELSWGSEEMEDRRWSCDRSHMADDKAKWVKKRKNARHFSRVSHTHMRHSCSFAHMLNILAPLSWSPPTLTHHPSPPPRPRLAPQRPSGVSGGTLTFLEQCALRLERDEEC